VATSDSRRIGSYVYTVVHDTGATQVAGLNYSLSATSYDDLQAKYAQLLAANFAVIDANQDDFFLPWTTTTKPGGSAAYTNTCLYALATPVRTGGQLRVHRYVRPHHARATDPHDFWPATAGYVYASATSLYMAVDPDLTSRTMARTLPPPTRPIRPPIRSCTSST